MAPNEKHLVWLSKELTKTQINYATVTANPIFQDGRDLGDLDDVTDTDPSELAELAAEPSIEVLSTVYQGHNNGQSCGSNKAVESIEDFAGMLDYPRKIRFLTILVLRHHRYLLLYTPQHRKHIPFGCRIRKYGFGLRIFHIDYCTSWWISNNPIRINHRYYVAE